MVRGPGRRHGRCRLCRRTALSPVLPGHRLRRHAAHRDATVHDGPRQDRHRTLRRQRDARPPLALRARAEHDGRQDRREQSRLLPRDQHVRSAGARHRDLQCVSRDRRRLLQQAAVLLLHRAASAARRDHGIPCELFRRSANRERQGCAQGHAHHAVLYVQPDARRSRASRRSAPTQPVSQTAHLRQERDGTRSSKWPTRMPSTTTITS